MNPWSWLPIPAILTFLAVAVTAGVGRGQPRGRTALVGAGLSSAGLLVALAWILSGVDQEHTSTAVLLAHASALLALPSWITLATRFGTAPGQSGGWALLVLAAGLIDVALVLTGVVNPRSIHVDSIRVDAPLLLQGGAPRALAGAFLLVGAAGLLRAQSLWDVARVEQREELRRGYAGLILCFLGFFLFSAQTLLYGAISLPILALASICFVPAVGALLPVLRAGGTVSRSLSPEARPVVSSVVLMGLGGFLILLAGVGEFMSRFAPAGRVLWFQWGGSILVGAYGALWLVPGFRRRFRRWLQVPELGRTLSWEARPLLDLVRPTGDGPALLLLSAIFEEPQGRPAVALWLRAADGAYRPWTASTSALPSLAADNPLLQTLRRDRPVLDLGRPPHRLALIPAYVENLGLVEQNRFRAFLLLRSGEEEIGLLAIAPRDPEKSAEDAMLLDLFRGELSLLTWGALAAWATPAPTEGQAFLYAQAAEFLHETAQSVAARTVAPRFGARLAAAVEEVAEQLAVRGRPRAPAPAGGAPRSDPASGRRGDEVRT